MADETGARGRVWNRNRGYCSAVLFSLLFGCATTIAVDQSSGAGTNVTFVPGEVTLTRNESIPLLLDGKTVGRAVYPKGSVLKVEAVMGDKLVVFGGGEKHLIPVVATDYSDRVERMAGRQPGAAVAQNTAPAARDEERLKAFVRKNKTGFFVGSIDKVTKDGCYVNVDWIGTPGIDHRRMIGCLDKFSYPEGRVFIGDIDTSELAEGDRWSSRGELGDKMVYGIGVRTNAFGQRCTYYTADFEKYYIALTNEAKAATPKR